jgi:hypothetical protein
MSNPDNKWVSTDSQGMPGSEAALDQEIPVDPDMGSESAPGGQDLADAQDQLVTSMDRGGNSTILQFVLSLAAVLSLWGIAALLLLLGVFSMAGLRSAGMTWNIGFLLQSASLAACGFMVLPSVITSYRRMRGNPLPQDYRPLLDLNPLLPALVLLSVLGIGYFSVGSNFAWLIMPLIHVLAIGLPVLIIVILGVRGLSTGSPQRRSGVFGAGVSLGPFVILFLETLALVAAIVFIVFYISTRPELLEPLMSFSEQFSRFQGDVNELLKYLAPFLTNPLIVAGALIFVSVIVPLIEEFFKPIGVWFLLGKKISPAEGFAAGILSGAGFAVFESLMLNSSPDDWLLGSVVRIGTAVIHITTAAFSGWALALVLKRRYINFALTYIGVVVVHGLWNGMAIMMLVNELAVSEGLQVDFPGLATFAVISPYVLVALTVIGSAALLLMNRSLRAPVNTVETVT